MNRRTVFLTLLLALLAIAAFLARHVRINLTPSLPRGLYWIHPGARPKLGDLVLFCPSLPHTLVGLDRAYLLPGRVCPGGSLPMQKRLVAGPGSAITITPSLVRINGVDSITPPPTLDSEGRPIASLYGEHSLGPGEWWVSTHHPLSWDSRYLGPIPEASILATSQPLLTEAP